jgi:dephospho-CoA kinase
VLDSEGRIDRRKLAEIVFADKIKLARLNKIVHPDVLNSIERWLAEQERGGAPLAVVEAALLIEAGSQNRLERLVVVWCHPEQQHERLRARGWTAEQIEQRIAAQMPLEAKRRMADDQIDCSGPLAETRRQVEELVARLMKLAAVKPHPLEKQP